MEIQTIFDSKHDHIWKAVSRACTVFAGSLIGAIYGVILTHSQPTIPPTGLGILLSMLITGIILIKYALTKF